MIENLISQHILCPRASCWLAGFVLMFGACAFVRAADDVSADPEAERRALKLPAGWEINLFAAEPMIVKPIQMNFDADGRLWVCSSSIYPQLKPGETADDKVFVLDDPHGTGRAQTSNVFAEGLLIPTGIEVGDGGVYVANSTEILHLRDTRGTGKADERRIVLSGFGTEDTHHIVHTFRWGFDGRLYFNQSIYIHSNLETPWGTQHLLGSGTWRFDTRALRLDILMRGLVNPWGLAFDRWGRSFETDGAGGQGVNYVFPGAAFESAVGVPRMMPGLNPHSPKYCGAEILSGRQIPDDWQGELLTSDFRASRVCRFQLTEDGAGFRSKQLSDFITSTDRAFRPVDIKMGPDGAIYIADWYNPIIQHGEVDFRDPRRDHIHGRIWRITAKGRPLVDRPQLSAAPVEVLLEALKAPEYYTRLRAKRVMRERGAEQVLPALQHWVKALKSKDPETEHQRLEALWTYQCIDVVEATLLRRVLKSDDPRARAAAARVCSRWAEQLDDAMELLEAAVADDDPRVRLEAVRVAAVEVPRSIVIATRVLDKPMDPVLDYALWRTANDLQPVWMPAMQSGQLSDWEKPAHLTFALQAVKSPAALAALVEQLRSGKLPPEARSGVIDLIASIDPDHQANTLFDLAVGKDITDAGTRLRLLAALERIAKERGAGSVKDTMRIATLFDDPDESLQAGAMRVAGFWKLEALRPQIVHRAEAADQPTSIRSAAMKALAALGGTESLATLRQLTDPPHSAATREIAVGALAALDLSMAAPRAVDLLRAGVVTEPSNLLASFRQREGGTDALAHSLAGSKLPSDVAKLSLRYLQTSGGTDQSLMDALRVSIGVTSGPTRLTPEQMKQTIADMLAKGDAARGERVFRRQEMGCFQCHAIGGVGGSLAPDLGSVGAASPPDYLIDSVLDPNKAVKDGYNGFTIATKSGEIYSGIKVREDKQELVLRDAAHDEIVIPTTSIRQQKEVGSLMPTGLADTLTRGEFLDLARFLSELGKPGPFAPGTTPLIRRWRVMDLVPQSLPSGQAPPVAPDDAGWRTAYSLVSGELPADSLAPAKGTVVFARCQIDVRSAGPVRLSLNSTRGLALWVDGVSVDPKQDLTIDLPIGVRSLIFRVDASTRGAIGLRAEVSDVSGAHALSLPLGGK